MNHQDWETVVLNKKSDSNIIKNNVYNCKVNNDDDEVQKQNLISLSNSKLIQQARCNQKLNQKQLANKLNIDQKMIQLYESGGIIPNIKIMVKLENILKIKLDKKVKKN
tara:strand:- start:1356 stop:1682 length:327 start_codon:yes stop_codon:yes gene_type:complete